MPGRTAHDLARRLYTPRCVACGYELMTDDTNRCSRCGCDFTQRPPRTYAEMEGIPMTGPLPDAGPARRARPRATGLVERWLWFFFLSMMLLFAIAALAVTALPD